jgi:hypothetical protein
MLSSTRLPQLGAAVATAACASNADARAGWRYIKSNIHNATAASAARSSAGGAHANPAAGRPAFKIAAG